MAVWKTSPFQESGMLNRLGQSRSRSTLAALALASLACAASGCGGGDTAKPPAEVADAPLPPPADEVADAPLPPPAYEVADAPLPPPAYEAALPPGVREHLYEPFTGDFDQMAKRRFVRLGTTFNRTFYFVDNGVQRGAAYELGQAFEEQLNKKRKTTNATKISVIFVPLPRDLLAAALVDGKVDCVAAQVIVRPELQAIVDFTNPVRTNVSEVVVTGPGAPAIASVDDLSGKDVHARKDSSAWASLVALNETLTARGRPPVEIQEVPGNLEDDDLLEMVNAGLIPAVVVHDYLAEFWKKIFTSLTVHSDVKLRTGASIALAFRKNSPLLAAELNAFVAKNGLGTALGNVIEKRYLVNTKFAKQANSEAARKKFRDLAGFFQKYAGQYDVDYLLMVAQGFQESGLDHNVKSRVGAVGVMQVMPATGEELKVGDISQVEPNIHAGVKYMRFVVNQYYKDEPMDGLNKWLFAFASYNAGPARVRQLRKEAAKRGLDPNVWFGNVEQIASERIGRETVTYVSNIYKYFVAYKLVVDERARRDEAREAVAAEAR
jgi:membrane-bound lytic murein transglycosylase MltF